jgi:hypothetical protein
MQIGCLSLHATVVEGIANCKGDLAYLGLYFNYPYAFITSSVALALHIDGHFQTKP